ncbi:MAG: hypothetical protein IJJ32_04560 [Eggerthellaceae bacterium]|nr:hypothetical protein [Eggerthellaceae bacterium]
MSETGRTIRGLSIAVTILAALSLVGTLVLGGLMGMLAISAASDDYVSSSDSIYSGRIDVDDLGLSPSELRELKALGIDIDEFGGIEISRGAAYDFAGIMLVLAGLISFLCMIAGAFSLVAGILGITRWNRPEKMQAVLIWAIVAAVFSLFVGRLISLVLLIIIAVEAYRYRRDYMFATMNDPMQGWTA